VDLHVHRVHILVYCLIGVKINLTAAVPKDLSLFRPSEKTPYLTDGYNGKNRPVNAQSNYRTQANSLSACMCVFNVIVKQMSKSRGNVVDPFDRLVTYSSDGLRFYLMKDGVAHSDGSSYSLFLFASFFARATYT